MKKIKNISVVGGGNIGTQFACACAKKGYNVRIHTSTPELYNGELSVVGDSDALSYSVKVSSVSDDIKETIFKDCDLIFVTQPASRFDIAAKMIEPYITEGVYIGAIPGTGGAEFAFRGCIEKGAVLFGLQRVPGVARLIERGRSVHVSGLRDHLYLSAIPETESEYLAEFIEDLFDIPCDSLPNYLSVTLTPSNPILHTTRLYSLFKDYVPGMTYDRNILFYEEWSDEASRILFACDNELQLLCRKQDRLDLSQVRSLKEHYESDTPEKLTKKIRSINSFKGLTSPMKLSEKGWIPDFSSRYFSADFPYGLAIIKAIADLIALDVPNISRVMAWYQNVTGSTSKFSLKERGINSLNDLYALYI